MNHDGFLRSLTVFKVDRQETNKERINEKWSANHIDELCLRMDPRWFPFSCLSSRSDNKEMNDLVEETLENKVVIFLGRTGSGESSDWCSRWITYLQAGKTSLFNLLSNSHRPLGNSVTSTTKTFYSKTLSGTTFIDTIGFHDTDDENEHKLQVVLLLKEIRHGFDISNATEISSYLLNWRPCSFLLSSYGRVHIGWSESLHGNLR